MKMSILLALRDATLIHLDADVCVMSVRENEIVVGRCSSAVVVFRVRVCTIDSWNGCGAVRSVKIAHCLLSVFTSLAVSEDHSLCTVRWSNEANKWLLCLQSNNHTRTRCVSCFVVNTLFVRDYGYEHREEVIAKFVRQIGDRCPSINATSSSELHDSLFEAFGDKIERCQTFNKCKVRVHPIGGHCAGLTASCQCYDPVSDHWTPQVMSERKCSALAIDVNEKVKLTWINGFLTVSRWSNETKRWIRGTILTAKPDREVIDYSSSVVEEKCVVEAYDKPEPAKPRKRERQTCCLWFSRLWRTTKQMFRKRSASMVQRSI